MSPSDTPGVVYQTDLVTLLDTREGQFVLPGPGEPFHGTGVKVQVLARDAEGHPLVQLLWVPPGTSSFSPGELKERHYHTTVREFVFTLEGELPFREYEDPYGDGELVVYKKGYFLDRRPGPASGHGMDYEHVSPTGCLMLEVRTGPRSQMAEKDSHLETVVITEEEIAQRRAGQGG